MSKLFVRQEIEAVEVLTGFETGNKYSVLGESGNKILYAYEEESNFIGKQIFGAHRSLKLHIINKQKQEIFTISVLFISSSQRQR